MEISRIATYSTNAQELLYEIVLTRSDVRDVPFETLSQYRTIRGLLAHCIGAEQRWLARILGAPLPDRYEDAASGPFEQLHADWREVRGQTTRIILSADADELNRRIETTLPTSPTPLSLSVEDILFQVFNHENYHRAQCSMLLQHHAVDPPNFDYVLLR